MQARQTRARERAQAVDSQETSMARAKSGMGGDKTIGHPTVGDADAGDLDEGDLASDIQGRNRLQGNDQGKRHNQREKLPDEARDIPDNTNGDASGRS